jgi:hypothetical protein
MRAAGGTATSAAPRRPPSLLYGGRRPSARAASTGSAFSSGDESDAGGAPATAAAAAASAERAEKYNALMRARMDWRDPFSYNPDIGLYYHEVAPDVLVGTQPRGRREVDALVDETGATTILCLQEDRDAEHWGVDLGRVARRAESRNVRHLRLPARDFDGESLRRVLPAAAAMIDRELQGQRAERGEGGGAAKSGGGGGGRVYVHCTAGLGRAPAAAIAWRYWFGSGGGGGGDGGGAAAEAAPLVWSLDAEYDAVTRVRPCGPRREAIAGATADLLRAAGLPAANGAADGSAGEEGATLTAEQRAAVQREAKLALERRLS